jgi:hypothetical protein
MLRPLLPALAFALAPLAAPAQTVVPDQPIPLKGNLTQHADLCPGGPAPEDCVLTLFIEGPAARLIFDSMRIEARREECTGGTEKVDGNGMYCNRADDGSVFCEVGYRPADQTFVYGGMGC